MTTLAADYSSARPNPAALKEAGYSAVLRYFSGANGGKDLTAAEAHALLEAGLEIGVVWETTAERPIDGPAAGLADGHAAVAEALRVGWPKGCAILCNIGDFAAAPASVAAIAGYYGSFAYVVTQAGYPSGGYGTRWIIDVLAGRGFGGSWWQNAMNDEGDLGDVVSPNASFYQRTVPTLHPTGVAPGEIDEDVELKPVPLWGSPAPKPPPPPAPLPTGSRVYSPPLVMEPWVASLSWPGRGIIGLAADGSVYALDGAPFLGSCCGQAFFKGRKAAAIEYRATGVAPGRHDGYVIIDTADERYNF